MDIQCVKVKRKWVRDGKRLQRMSTMLDENVLDDNEVLLLKADATNAIEKLIVQHNIPEKPRRNRQKFSLEPKSKLLSLPLELFLNITTYIDIKDVENLSKTCKDLQNQINRTFITKVVLPLSQFNLDKLGGKSGRFILSLSSNVNIRLWSGDLFEMMLRNMNLKYLKEMKFVGNNYSVQFGGGLISEYKSIMRNIFSNKKFVRKMDISVDSCLEYYKLLEKLKFMPHLKELCLRSSSLRSQFNKTMPDEKTLNELLNNTLGGLNIKTLELKGFSMPWGEYSGSFGLQIVSHSIEILRLQYSKNFELAYIEAENLKQIEIESDYHFFCLYHAQCTEGGWLVYNEDDPPGRLAGILARGCPKLESYNGLDLDALRKESTEGNWLEVLENHKGEGMDSEDSKYHCQQCDYNKNNPFGRGIRDYFDSDSSSEYEL